MTAKVAGNMKDKVNDKVNDKEQGAMAMYREARSGEFVGEASRFNHLAWSLLAIAVGLIFWLLIALANAENQRNALFTRACQDRVFPTEVDMQCLSLVQTRAHWWQHAYYALTHLRP